jgi:hypothetical protein
MLVVLEVSWPPEAPFLSCGPAGGESLADSVDTAAWVRRGVQERKDMGKRVEGLSAQGAQGQGDLTKAV